MLQVLLHCSIPIGLIAVTCVTIDSDIARAAEVFEEVGAGEEKSRPRLAAEASRRFGGKETQDEEENSEDEADRKIEVIARLREGEPERRENQKRQAEGQEDAAFHWSSLRESHRSRFGGLLVRATKRPR